MSTKSMKKTMGRQKIEIKKLEKKSNKQVTYSKCGARLFKKAGELSVLCGIEVATIVFSPSEKIFYFRQPNVEYVIDFFLSENSSPSTPVETYILVAKFNQRLTGTVAELAMEKKCVAASRGSQNDGRFWSDEPMENLGVEELRQIWSLLQDLRAEVVKSVERMAAERM